MSNLKIINPELLHTHTICIPEIAYLDWLSYMILYIKRLK